MDKATHNSQNSITSPIKLSEDAKSEQSLRPESFDHFIGQEKIVENLKIFVSAARMREESLDHVLLHQTLHNLHQLRDHQNLLKTF